MSKVTRGLPVLDELEEGTRMRPRLRLYDPEIKPTIPQPPPVTVRLGEITKILRDAVASDRTWLADFDDEEVQISPDLYEVLSAYWQIGRSA